MNQLNHRQADENGWVSFTGFRGDYTVRTDTGSAGFTLEKDLLQQLTLNL